VIDPNSDLVEGSTSVATVAVVDYAVSALDPTIVKLAKKCNWRMDEQIPARILLVAKTDAIKNAKQKLQRRITVTNTLKFAATPATTNIFVALVAVVHVYLTATCSEGAMEGECLMHTCEHSIDTCSLQLSMRFIELQLLVRRALNRQQFGLRLNMLWSASSKLGYHAETQKDCRSH